MSLGECDCLPFAESAAFDTKTFGFAGLKLDAKGLQVCIQHKRWEIPGLPRRGTQSRKWPSRVLFQNRVFILIEVGLIDWLALGAPIKSVISIMGTASSIPTTENPCAVVTQQADRRC